jgi:hypothetical protein
MCHPAEHLVLAKKKSLPTNLFVYNSKKIYIIKTNNLFDWHAYVICENIMGVEDALSLICETGMRGKIS